MPDIEPVRCPECWSTPMGIACYHICPNSTHFYSPEQERADEAFYGQDDVHERYHAETIGLEDYDPDEDPCGWEPDDPAHVSAFGPAETDDIPF